jgi:hypothetical protein
MPRVFLGNFDFEHELTNGPDRSRPGSAGRPVIPQDAPGSDLAWAWTAIAEADDTILTCGEISPGEFGDLVRLGLPIPRFVELSAHVDGIGSAQFVPWGWTPLISAFGKSCGWKCLAPPADIISRVNSRAFRFLLEEQWQIGPAGTALVTSTDELCQVLANCGDWSHGWLLKANFGMSGREALRGRGAVLDDAGRNWAIKRLRTSGPIVVEPLVERIDEAGIQIEIPEAGQPELVGITPLLVDRAGVYRRSRFGSPASELTPWQPAVEVALRAAREIQRLGYFGPLGIDAMQYRDPAGQIRLRPLQDLNARYTMGRLALGFRRALPAGWCGSWLHFGAKQLGGRDLRKWLAEVTANDATASRIVVTSPRTISSQPAHRHAVLILAPTAEDRNNIERALFTSLGMDVAGGDARP